MIGAGSNPDPGNIGTSVSLYQGVLQVRESIGPVLTIIYTGGIDIYINDPAGKTGTNVHNCLIFINTHVYYVIIVDPGISIKIVGDASREGIIISGIDGRWTVLEMKIMACRVDKQRVGVQVPGTWKAPSMIEWSTIGFPEITPSLPQMILFEICGVIPELSIQTGFSFPEWLS